MHFEQIAKEYDRNNAILSLGICKLWNQKLIKAMGDGPLLDLCAGTGAIAFGHLKKRGGKVILLDQSGPMLEEAKKRAPKGDITYIKGDAQAIPLEDASVNNVTTAYGIRNVADPLQCAHEVYRVLKPGGIWGILELTRPTARPLRFMHKTYLNNIIPLVGKLLSSDKQAYEYLASSIQKFTAPEELACFSQYRFGGGRQRHRHWACCWAFFSGHEF